MKNKLPIIISAAGLFLILFSTARWGFVFYDLSQFVFGVIAGGIIMVYGYIYWWMRKIDDEINKFRERLEAISKWWMERELE